MRNTGLDILRLVAVLLVLARHMPYRLFGDLPQYLQDFFMLTIRGGWVGVDLFFVLSGFLVSGLFFREKINTGQVSVGRFLIRRGLKIYPAFYFFLAITITDYYLRRGSFPDTYKILADVFFVQNYFRGMWAHTWSLAVEEHFYILLAAIILFFKNRSSSSQFSYIPTVFFIIATTCLALRIINHQHYGGVTVITHFFPTHLRVDSLFFGVFLSYLVHYKNLEQRISKLPTLLLSLIGSALIGIVFVFEVSYHHWMTVYGFILIYIGAGILVLAAIRIKQTKNILIKILASLGSASYSIYLWHLALLAWTLNYIRPHIGDNFLMLLTVYFCISLIVGWLLSRIVEFPALYLRDHFFPSRSNPIEKQ